MRLPFEYVRDCSCTAVAPSSRMTLPPVEPWNVDVRIGSLKVTAIAGCNVTPAERSRGSTDDDARRGVVEDEIADVDALTVRCDRPAECAHATADELEAIERERSDRDACELERASEVRRDLHDARLERRLRREAQRDERLRSGRGAVRGAAGGRRWCLTGQGERSWRLPDQAWRASALLTPPRAAASARREERADRHVLERDDARCVREAVEVGGERARPIARRCRAEARSLTCALGTGVTPSAATTVTADGADAAESYRRVGRRSAGGDVRPSSDRRSRCWRAIVQPRCRCRARGTRT